MAVKTNESHRIKGETPETKRVNFYVLFLYLILPIIVHWNVLTQKGNNHLGQPYFNTFKATDLAGSMRNAWVLKSMPLPWSREYLTNYPEGDFFWRWQNFTQLIQLLFQWAYTRVGTPAHSVALLTIIGWASTSFILYWACRSRGISILSSILTGLVFQILPAVFLKATTETSMMYTGLVLLATIFTQNYLAEKSKKNLYRIVSTISFTLFFDTYVLYMSVLAVFIVIVVSKNTPQIFKRVILSIATIGYALSIIFFQVLTNVGDGETADSRPLIPPDSFVKQWLSGISPYVSPTDKGILTPLASTNWNYRLGPEFLPNLNQYLGLFVISIAAVGIYSLRGKFRAGKDLDIRIIVIVFFLITMDTSFKLPFLDFGVPAFADLMKYALPGARIFSRFGLVAALILMIFLAHGLDYLLSGLRKKRKVGIGLFLFLLIYSDLGTFSQTGIAPEAKKFEAFTSAMKNTKNPVLLQIPFPGRAWTDSSFLFNSENQISMVNPLYSSSPRVSSLILKLVSQNQENVIGILNCLKVDYVIAETNQDSRDATALTKTLNSTPFRLVRQISLPGGDSSYNTSLGLYSVPKLKGLCDYL